MRIFKWFLCINTVFGLFCVRGSGVCLGAELFSQYGQIQNVQNYSSNPFSNKNVTYGQKMPVPVNVKGPDVNSGDCMNVVSNLIVAHCSVYKNCAGMRVSDVRPAIVLALSQRDGHNYATNCIGYIDTEFDKYIKNTQNQLPGYSVSFPSGTTVANPNLYGNNTTAKQDNTVPEWKRAMQERAQELKDLQEQNGTTGSLAHNDFAKTYDDLSFATRRDIEAQGMEPYKDKVVFHNIKIANRSDVLCKLGDIGGETACTVAHAIRCVSVCKDVKKGFSGAYVVECEEVTGEDELEYDLADSEQIGGKVFYKTCKRAGVCVNNSVHTVGCPGYYTNAKTCAEVCENNEWSGVRIMECNQGEDGKMLVINEDKTQCVEPAEEKKGGEVATVKVATAEDEKKEWEAPLTCNINKNIPDIIKQFENIRVENPAMARKFIKCVWGITNNKQNVYCPDAEAAHEIVSGRRNKDRVWCCVPETAEDEEAEQYQFMFQNINVGRQSVNIMKDLCDSFGLSFDAHYDYHDYSNSYSYCKFPSKYTQENKEDLCKKICQAAECVLGENSGSLQGELIMNGIGCKISGI